MTVTADVPTSLDRLLGYSSECGCGRVHAVELTHAAIRGGALAEVVGFAREIEGTGEVLVVGDRVTHRVAGESVRLLLEKDGRKVRALTLPDGAGERPHADEETLALVEAACDGARLAVAVGAGTVNDLVKLATFRRGVPYIVVATAPSMNGYTSAIAAIMMRGLKRTVECHQPRGVVADLDILCEAPRELTAAGLGDLESKPTSTADYRLGGLLRGGYHCTAPEVVVMAAERRASNAAAGLKDGDPASIAALTEALVLSGISMKLAGTSSPASGGEHLISHHWDMTAHDEGRVEGWHGAQVGVTTIVAAALYERLAAIDPETIDVERLVSSRPPWDETEVELRARHGSLAGEVVPEFRSKRLDDDAYRAELTQVKNGWSDIWSNLGEVLRPAARVREILSAAGAPTTVQELGLTPEHLTRSFLAAREIRGRFTVLDLAADLGVLEKVRDEVLSRSGCLGV